MKKQMTLGLAAVLLASSSFAITFKSAKPTEINPGEKRVEGHAAPGKGAAMSREQAYRIERNNAIKKRLGLQSDGLNTLTEGGVGQEISYDAKVEDAKGNAIGSRREVINVNKFTEEVIALHEKHEAEVREGKTPSMNATQVEGVNLLLKVLSVVKINDMVEPGEKDVNGRTMTLEQLAIEKGDAIKFLRVAKSTIESLGKEGSDTTIEDVQAYTNLCATMFTGVKPGEQVAVHKLYRKIGENAMKRNAGCTEL